MRAKDDFTDTLVVLVAAGRGTRAGGEIPKQYRMLAGTSVLDHAINRMIAALPGAKILPVIHPDDLPLYEAATGGGAPRPNLQKPCFGGASRQESVRAGLEVLSEIGNERNIVLIHDSVRPFASIELIQNMRRAAGKGRAAAPAIPVVDSLRRHNAGGLNANGLGEPVDRTGLQAVQTPQAFNFVLIRDSHRRAAAAELHDFTDDASLAEWSGANVRIVPGDAGNFKLTMPQDFIMAEALLMASHGDIRTGFGYDVHAFCAGDHVWLGGVKIAHDRGLDGHSDADVGLHALTDAILGALADGDIGQHFPPSDPRWRGAASEIFLREAAARVRARKGLIAHLDLTLVCEAPKIGPHRDAIRSSIAAIAGLSLDRVAVKATTSEKLGFTGRREGIAASAVATIRLPFSPG